MRRKQMWHGHDRGGWPDAGLVERAEHEHAMGSNVLIGVALWGRLRYNSDVQPALPLAPSSGGRGDWIMTEQERHSCSSNRHLVCSPHLNAGCFMVGGLSLSGVFRMR